MTYQLLQGDNRQVLRTLPAKSVHCVVTSPPYAGLRDYGVDGQIGLESEPDCLAWARKEPPCSVCYVCALRSVFAEVWRVLRDDGVCWLNLGSSFASENIESSSYVLRRDLTQEEYIFVLQELAKHGTKADTMP